MVKDEIDLMMEIEWLLVQEYLLKERAKAIEKEIHIMNKYEEIRKAELETLKSMKKK